MTMNMMQSFPRYKTKTYYDSIPHVGMGQSITCACVQFQHSTQYFRFYGDTRLGGGDFRAKNLRMLGWSHLETV